MKYQKNGFTLVELMIAVALMVILTGSIVFVFTQAQRIYSNTNEAVKVYQQARAAMDTMERDFANVTKSMEMEFWGPDKQDPQTKLFDGHFNPQNGEANLMLAYQYTYSNPDLAKYRNPASYRILDTGTCKFLFAPLIAKGEYTDNSPWGGGLVHSADAIYFKAETAIPNKGTRTALIKYGLSVDNTWKRAPILMKWVVWLDQTGGTPKIQAEAPQALCYFVTDMKVEIYIRNKRLATYSPGDYYNVEEAYTTGGFPNVINAGNVTADNVTYKKFFSPLFIYMRQKDQSGVGTD
ncbi:MAG: prepilin-type N-terminal cleavage/methylation domain-containing protein, partial [Planctomycetota bacterium]